MFIFTDNQRNEKNVFLLFIYWKIFKRVTVLPRLWGNRNSCVFPGGTVKFLDFPEDSLTICIKMKNKCNL